MPSSLIYLFIGSKFNHPINDLPCVLQDIRFGYWSNFDKELNCLPNSIENIQLPPNYNHQIINIPKKLKKITCGENYKYLEKFNELNITILKYKIN